MPIPHTLPTTPTGASKYKNRTAPINSPMRWIPPPASSGNNMLPSSPSSSSFVVPPSGLRKGEKRFTNIRVVARIRPLNEKEKKLGPSLSTIRTLYPDPISPSLHDFSNEECRTVAALAARFNSPKNSPTRIRSIPQTITSPSLNDSNMTTPISKNTSSSHADSERFFSSPTTPKTRTRSSRIQPPSPPMANLLSNKNSPVVQNKQSLEIGISSRKKRFDYDAVFEPDISQQEVYEQSVGDAVRCNIFRGYNTTIIAYGQTGSGKTHTMTGPRSHEEEGEKENHLSSTMSPPSGLKRKSLASYNGLQKLAKINDSLLLDSTKNERNSPRMENKEFGTKGLQSGYGYDDSFKHQITCDDGIIPRAINDLFVAKQRNATGGDVTIKMTYLEIYNDEIYDLLDESKDSYVRRSLHDHGDNGVLIKDLTCIKVVNQQHACTLMRAATKRRKTGSNELNKCSSRSHSICTLHVTISPALRKSVTTGKLANFTSTDIISAKLTLVDLAGSERLKQTKVEDGSKKESININKDLFVLGKVISALAEKSNQGKQFDNSKRKTSRSIHIPYRDCKMTRILRDSLGGNCCTVMVACLSPSENHIEESMNTLRYAERTRSITNVIKRNVAAKLLTPAECAALRRENKVLKKKITQMTRLLMLLEKENRMKNEGQTSVDEMKGTDNQTKTSNKVSHSSNSGVVQNQKQNETQTNIIQHVEDSWRQKYDKLAELCENIGISIDSLKDIHADDATIVSVQSLKRQIENALATYKSKSYDDDTLSTCSRSSTISSGDPFFATKFHDETQNSQCDESISTFLTDWTDEDTISTTTTTDHHSIDDEIVNKQAVKDRLEDEIFGLEEKVALLNSKLESMNCQLKELIEKKASVQAENNQILKEFEEKELKVSNLLKEKELKIQAVEIEITAIDKSLTEKKETEKNQKQNLDNEIAEKQVYLNKITRYADSVEHDVTRLEKERTDLVSEVEKLQIDSDLLSELTLERESRVKSEEEVQKLREELEKSKKDSASMVKDLKEELEKFRMEKSSSKMQSTVIHNSNNTFEEKIDASPAKRSSLKFYNELKELERKQDGVTGNKKIMQIEQEVKKLWAILEKIEYEKNDNLEVDSTPTNYFMTPSLAALVKKIESEKEAKMFIQSSQKDARDFLSNTSYTTPPRSIRRNYPESRDDVSLMTPITVSKAITEYQDIETDCNSILFQDEMIDQSSSCSIYSDTDNCSLNSEQQAIRSHAHKMLYWANKAIERKGCNSSNSSTTSSVGSFSASLSGCMRSQNTNPMPTLPSKCKTKEEIVTTCVEEDDDDHLEGDSIIASISSKEENKPNLFNDDNVKMKCTCSGSMFSGNEEHMEFFLPKLGLHCSCGAVDKSESYYWEDPTSLSNVLRPWQVDFLKSQGISSLEKFIKYHKRNSKSLAIALKYWRRKKDMKPARTKSCMIALHIWSRTAKTISKSIVEQQLSGDKDNNPKLKFTQIQVRNYHEDADSVATPGCKSVNLIGYEDECEI